MSKKREYKHCLWCGKTIDTTDNDNDLCGTCAKYPSINAMIKAATLKAKP